ncbi:MAG TPA: hypothetical protein VFB06_11480 [Streptosporangiaceae bacterium]|nr:hypothetical protein [Streptosporangiaceae bacterium]
MSNLIMFDSITPDLLPTGAGYCYAGYVSGRWPDIGTIRQRFPHARTLSIAIDAAHDADALDIETGDATPADAAAWYERQRARGVTRPCLYASADLMQRNVVPLIEASGIARSAVRLWSAHYSYKAHICGPASCRLMSIEADGTQWTDTALGRDLDESLLAADFFGTAPHPKPAPVPPEVEVQSGQLSQGPGAVTVISVPWGSASTIAFGCDNSLQGLPPVKLRVAIYDTGWRVSDNVVVDSTKGQTVLKFTDKARTGVISVRREDPGDAVVGWQVS